MTRSALRGQLERIRSLWPSMQATTQAVTEWERALYPFSDLEIEKAVDTVIATYTEPAAPKPGHITAQIRAGRGPVSTSTHPDKSEPIQPLRPEDIPDWRHVLKQIGAGPLLGPEPPPGMVVQDGRLIDEAPAVPPQLRMVR